MASSVDNRIVQMTFDNATFEKRISATLQSLENLNRKIDAGGFNKLSESASKVNMGGLASSIEGVSTKFLALSTIGITALANITNRAIDAGLAMSRAFTVEPITQGFSEYELKMGSIQTIMAGSGASLEEVNQKLEELNTYSDRTIYSFADMTQNIGKFTNAGVSLDESVAAIQGVANVAAVSGANANEASRAMYNFGQAMGSGVVRLIDWKSIENANMATAEFKQQLIDTAVELGVITKGVDGYQTAAGTALSATQGFNESLQDQWLTSEVLTKTLGQYADETTEIGKKAFAAATDVKTFSQLIDTVKEGIGSGWAYSFEILIGNFDQAKALFTDINDAIGGFVGKNAAARNELLQSFVDFGGRAAGIEGIKNTFIALGDILRPIKEAFREIFPPKTGRDLAKIAFHFWELSHALKPSEETMDKLKRTFKGLFAALDIGFEIIKGVWGLFTDLFGLIAGPSSSAILTTTANFGDFLVGLRDILVDGGKIKEWFASLKDFIKDPLPALQELIDKIDEFLRGLGVDVPDIWSKITDGVDTVKAKIEEALGPNIIDGLKNGLEEGKEVIAEFAQGLIDKAKEILGIRSPSEVFKEIGIYILEGLAKGLEAGAELISTAFDAIMDASIFEKAADAAKKVLDIIKKIVNKLQEVFEFPSLATLFAFSAAASSGGIFLMLKKIADFFGKDGIGALKDGAVDVLENVSGVLKSMSLDIKAGALLKIAGAVGILALSLTLMAFVDGEKMAKSIAALAAAFTQLIASFAVLQKLSNGPKSAFNMAALAIGLGLLAGAVLMLAASVALLGMLDGEQLAKGLGSVTVLLAVLSGFAKSMEKNTASLISAGVGITIISGALLLLSASVLAFGYMDLPVLIQGLATVAVLLVGLGGAMHAFPSDMAARTAGLFVLATAIAVLAGAIMLIGQLNKEELAKGLIGIAGALAGITLAVKYMPEKDLNRTALAILALGVAMNFIARAMHQISQLGWKDIVKSVGAIVSVMTTLMIATRAMEKGVKGAGALLLMTFSLGKLKDVVVAFAGVPFTTLAKGLGQLALSLAVIGGMAWALSAVTTPLLLLGAGLMLLGVGFAAIGLGANLFAKAIQIVVKTGPKGQEAVETLLKGIGKAIPLLAKGFAQGLVEIAKTLLESLPVFVELIAKLIFMLLDKVIEMAPKLGEALKVLIQTGIASLATLASELATAGLQVLLSVLQGIRDNIGEITTVVFEIITGFMNSLSENIPTMVDPTVKLITTFFESVAEALGKLSTSLLVNVGIAFMEGFWDGITESFGKMKDFVSNIINGIIDFFKGLLGINSPSTVMMEIGGFVIDGLIEGLKKGFELLKAWFIDLPIKILGWFADAGGWLLDKGWDILVGLSTGILNKWLEVSEWFADLGNKVKTAIGSLFTLLKDKGLDLIKGLWNGIVERWNTLKDWFSDVPEKIKSAIGSLYETLKSHGKNLIIGLWNGINDKFQWIKDRIEGFAGDVIDWLKDRFWIGSPSRITTYFGEMLGEGLIVGLESTSNKTAQAGSLVVENLSTAMNRAMSALASDLSNSAEFNPKITPVLDLSNVKANSKTLDSLLPSSARYSSIQAGAIASTRIETDNGLLSDREQAVVKFEQTINAPTRLSTIDIYRSTRNQIELAKEELKIP